jgi:hypothetical protein
MRAKVLVPLVLLAALPAGAAILERPGLGGITVIPDMPGWWHAGSRPAAYAIELDRAVPHGGRASARLRAVEPDAKGFGSLMQMAKADKLLGKRVRLSGWVRAEGVARSAGLWMRVDGPALDPTRWLALDAMSDRRITGTRPWQRYEIVLEVAPDAVDIAFGATLSGPGTIWVDDLRFDVVDASVPLTGSQKVLLRPEPQNLGFEN